MSYKFALLISITLSCFTQTVFAQMDNTKRTFTVEESIKMVKIVEPNVNSSALYHPEIKMSQDGKYFVIVTRRGNPATGKNEYNLLLYQSSQVRAFLNDNDGMASLLENTSKSQDKLPESRILAHVTTSLNESAFQSIAWLEDNKTLAFIGWFDTEEDETSGQVYKLDIRSGILNKLTNHPRPVTGFAFNIASQKIVFVSKLPPKLGDDREKSSYLVGVRLLPSVNNPNYEISEGREANQYYVQDIERAGHALAIGQIYNDEIPYPLISLSPDGYRAIVLTPKDPTPLRWKDGYNFLQTSFFKKYFNGFDDNIMLSRAGFLKQFSLIDLRTGNIRPVFDAPTGYILGGLNIDAHWMPDSNSVILANTALPLDVTDEEEKNRRSHMFSTVEYNVDTGRITPITYHTVEKYYAAPDSMETPDGQFWALTLELSGTLKIEERKDVNKILPAKIFKKIGNKWVPVQESQTATDAVPAKKTGPNSVLEISIHQDLNTPPEIMAQDKSTGVKKIITDLNPQFQKLTFGRTQILNWKDRNGKDWTGGLVYPPNFKEGQKYPLVIQTHGFNPKEFLIDGPSGVASAYAAQALANKGIMVLQMKDGMEQKYTSLSGTQRGYEAAIDHLVAMKLIDRKKVGMIGWSATSVPIQHTLLYSEYPIAAAILADSYNIDMGAYGTMFGMDMKFVEKMNDGAVPWGEGLKKWMANDPTFHMDRLRTPLRLEQYTTPPSLWWNTYTILKRQHKPVEYYVFNDAYHDLVKPAHRMASQGGNVDWFAFWLKGEEDPDPAKADQYKRWRKLRIQQEKSIINANKARKWDKEQKTRLANTE